MVTIRIKNNPTLGNLQGPFELSIQNKNTWYAYAYDLEKIVKFFGKDRHPNDIFKQDVANLKAHLMEHHGYTEKRARRSIAILASFYTWMVDMQLADGNPAKKTRAMREVEFVVEPEGAML